MAPEITCPICRSKEIKFFCEKNGYKIYRCFDCDLIFVWPMPGNLAAIYSAPYFKRSADDKKENKFGYVDYEEDKEAAREIFISYLDKISQLTKGRKIFDVGAATGYFLDIAKKQGWSTGGMEISAYAAAIAKHKGHDVLLGDLAELKIEGKYDVVTMWDVLEHLSDPVGYLKLINNILNPDGILAINTIDSSSFWARLWGKNWHAILPPEHLFYYSAKSLKILLENNGFKIIEQAKIGKRFTLPYICKILANSYHLPFLSRFSDFLNKLNLKISLPVNLRDNIFIIALK
ncbi:MAG: class I SAM-dependent methyltransferase [Patescibacteria group bacterium]